jgi:hypothetical protein
MCWIDTYLSPLNFITSDIRKNFASKEFKKYANIISICIKAILVKAYNFINIVERYYNLLQQVY